SLSPRHQHLPQKRKVLPMSPVQNVTYLSGRADAFSSVEFSINFGIGPFSVAHAMHDDRPVGVIATARLLEKFTDGI
ncbi:hypothetical protein, partial [Rhizobium mesoamericanum]|uniref:hypothetical protein n=1 Tax=Rhizobium mesoamericanum TaxID=1079800 RepID=UPI0027D840E0